MNLNKGFVRKMRVDRDWRDIRETVGFQSNQNASYTWMEFSENNFNSTKLMVAISNEGNCLCQLFPIIGPSIFTYPSKTKGLILKIPFIGHSLSLPALSSTDKQSTPALWCDTGLAEGQTATKQCGMENWKLGPCYEEHNGGLLKVPIILHV